MLNWHYFYWCFDYNYKWNISWRIQDWDSELPDFPLCIPPLLLQPSVRSVLQGPLCRRPLRPGMQQRWVRVGWPGLCWKHAGETGSRSPGAGGALATWAAAQQLLSVSARAQPRAAHERGFPFGRRWRADDLPLLRQPSWTPQAQHQTLPGQLDRYLWLRTPRPGPDAALRVSKWASGQGVGGCERKGKECFIKGLVWKKLVPSKDTDPKFNLSVKTCFTFHRFLILELA